MPRDGRRAHGGRDRRGQRGRPGAEERPGDLRARDGGGPRRRGDAAGGARGAAARGPDATHLFQFAAFVEGFRGWGRSLRRAIGGWYAAPSPESLAYQAVKYRQREGMTHRDLLRLAHPAGRVGAGNPTLE